MGQKREKSGGEKETINECAAHRLNLFWCGHIKLLWDESRRSSSRKPGIARLPTQEENDKSVQDAADKDNYRTAYAWAVKPSLIAPIKSKNYHIVCLRVLTTAPDSTVVMILSVSVRTKLSLEDCQRIYDRMEVRICDPDFHKICEVGQKEMRRWVAGGILAS